MTVAPLDWSLHRLASLPALALDAPVTVDRDQARRLASDELANGRYHRHDPGLPQRGVRWLLEQLNASGQTPNLRGPGAVVGLLVLVLVIGVVAYGVRRASPSLAGTGRQGALFEGAVRSAEEHRAAANAFAAAGQWAEALRERVRALVRSLEERGLLEPGPGRTAAEAAAEAAVLLPGHSDGLASAARTFEQVWYGGRTATAADQDAVRLLDERVRATRARLAQVPVA